MSRVEPTLNEIGVLQFRKNFYKDINTHGIEKREEREKQAFLSQHKANKKLKPMEFLIVFEYKKVMVLFSKIEEYNYGR